MNFSRTQTRLTSFALSAMLTSAVLSTSPNASYRAAAAGPQPAAILRTIEAARAAGWAGSPAVYEPAKVLAPTAPNPVVKVVATVDPLLTPAQLLRIRRATEGSMGHNSEILPNVAAILGLTGPGGVVSLRSINYRQGASAEQFYIGPDYYLFGRTDGVTVQVFKYDLNLKPITGASAPVGGNFVLIPDADLPARAAEPLRRWAELSEKLPAVA